MRPVAFSDLRVRLLSIVLLALLPALGFTVYAALEQRRVAAEQVKESALQLVRLVSAEQDQALEGAREVLILLAHLPEIQAAAAGDAARCEERLRDVLRVFRRYANLGVIGMDGRVRCSARPSERELYVDDRAYFQRAVRTKRFAVGDYQIGRITRVASINFGYPLLGLDGGLNGVVYAALDLGWLNRAPAYAGLPEGTTLTLTDPHGGILVRYPDPERWVGRNAAETDAYSAILAAGGDGTAEGVGLDGEERLFAHTALRDEDDGDAFHLVISIPERVAFAGIDRILAPNLLALALFLLLAALAAGWAGSVLVLRPVEALLGATRRLAAGDLTARSEVRRGPGELAELARAFDEMAERLQESVQGHEHAQEALRQANESLRALIDASPIAVLSLDREGRIQTWNAAAQRIFGWSAAEVVGQAPPFVPAERRSEYETIVRRVLAGESVAGSEVTRVRRDGSPVDIRVWAGPLHDRTGATRGVMAVVEDITEWKRLEQQFRQAQKMEAVGRLAGGVAHDFNNLLTAILGHSSLILEGLDAAHPSREDAEEVRAAAERASALTRQLLAFSRQQILEPRVLDLNEVVLQMEKLLRRLIGEDIELVSVLAPDVGRVRADPGQIEQVVMNLAVNARDAMPEGGTLTIETANVELDESYARRHLAVVPGPYVMLAVTDTGTGMDAETQAHLFEPFFTTKEVGKGTGLGLATVYGIVKQSEGNIWTYSELGRGTTIKIYLPRVEAAAETEPTHDARRALRRGTETILVAEDESLVRSLVTRVLRQCGYAVIEAADAREAMRLAETHANRIHLLLTDLVMPEMGGRELAECLRSTRTDLKVLYMSGYTDRGVSRQRGFEPGAAFLEKPFTPHTLAAKVRAVLDAE